jgi:hypothetical protein
LPGRPAALASIIAAEHHNGLMVLRFVLCSFALVLPDRAHVDRASL